MDCAEGKEIITEELFVLGDVRLEVTKIIRLSIFIDRPDETLSTLIDRPKEAQSHKEERSKKEEKYIVILLSKYINVDREEEEDCYKSEQARRTSCVDPVATNPRRGGVSTVSKIIRLSTLINRPEEKKISSETGESSLVRNKINNNHDRTVHAIRNDNNCDHTVYSKARKSSLIDNYDNNKTSLALILLLKLLLD